MDKRQDQDIHVHAHGHTNINNTCTCIYIYTCTYMYLYTYMYMCMLMRDAERRKEQTRPYTCALYTRGSSFFLGKVTALGVLCCFALFVCLTLLASFFLPSHLSFKNMHMPSAQMLHVHVHVYT